jgi:hypothetical protein
MFTGGTAHGNGVGIYQEWGFRADSNTFDSIETGINFKTNLAGSASWYNTAAYNTIRRPTWSGVEIYCWGGYDSIYGNTIIDAQDCGVRIISPLTGGGDTTSTGNHFIGNNTFYNCTKAIATGTEGPTRGTNVAKYNAAYNESSSRHWIVYAQDTSYWTIDSNIYYSTTPTYNISNLGNLSFANWQNEGYDTVGVNSTNNVDPGFTDAANGDFTRASASGEVGVSYGGRRWNIFGAVQNAGYRFKGWKQ